jgi:hemolysin activation/secretion protein
LGYQKNPGFNRISVLLAALLLMTAQPLLAADPDTEERLRRQRDAEAERSQRESAPDVRLQMTESISESLPIETPCFKLNAVEFTGERLEDFPWLENVAAAYIGQCVGQQGINAILRGIGAEFLRRGYITTRVGLPAQDLNTGVLTLTVVPGIIRDIRYAIDSGRSNRYTAFPTGSGEILNLRDIEQGLEQIKRVPSQDVEMEIVPGELPGESDIVLNTTATKPFRVGISLDDAGSRDTGKLQAAATLFLDSPLMLNDLLSINVNQDAEDKTDLGSRGDSVSYSVPFGNWEFGVGSNNYRYHQTIRGVNQSFVSRGRSEGGDLSVKRLLMRDQLSKLHARLRVATRDSRSFIDDTEILVQRRQVTSAELSFLYKRYIGSAQIDTAVTHRQGVPWFDAQEDFAIDSDDPTLRYKLQSIDGNLILPFTLADRPFTYNTELRGQITDDVLFGADYFSIGNRYTVRGFDGEEALAAERGWVWRNELGTPIGFGLELYTGFDMGRVSGPGAELLAGRTLSGGVLGLRGSLGQLQYETFAGWALQKPDDFKTSRPAAGFQLYWEW